MGGTLAAAVAKSVSDKIAVADFDASKTAEISAKTGASSPGICAAR